MTKPDKSKLKYYCPRCGSTKIIDMGEKFRCPRCKRNFFKKYTRQFRGEDGLTSEDIENLTDSLTNNADLQKWDNFIEEERNDLVNKNDKNNK
ncbi:MAG: hypothetical protein GF317_13380 [Candidatus Lokiarchaeota archaeon]|nr:hypothetical protein [Candidatus Lokiarchaeota archaeon]MBD3200629.1 hypothetical protein [Candidatus Lokiarchaeota archaeon]